MVCDPLQIFNPACCNTRIVPTDLEQKTIDYYSCVSSEMVTLLNQFYSAEALGNEPLSEESINRINDYHYLYAYLVMIYFQRIEDAALDTVCHKDKGLSFYLTEYNIACIRKYFECKRVNIDSLLQSFDMFSSDGVDGVNFMSIEEAASDNCPDNDELFIVEKPI